MTESDEGADILEHRDWGLTCAEFLELTTEYLDGALSDPDSARFDAHLAKCEGCATVLRQLQDQIDMTGQLLERDIAPESMTKLLDAFADWKSTPPIDRTTDK